MSTHNKTVLVVPDTHFPFECKKSLAKVHAVAKEIQPDLIIQVGDLYDMFSYSKYAKSLSVMAPKEESARARVCAEKMWTKFRADCQKARLVQLVGNHDERPLIKILEKTPENEHIAFDWFRRFMSFEGVETILDAKQEFIYDGVCYMHGFRKFGEHALYNQMNTVCGHLHRGAVQWEQNINGSYFELNAGFLGNKSTKAFDYRSQKKLNKMTLGFGLIDRYGPRFVSLE